MDTGRIWEPHPSVHLPTTWTDARAYYRAELRRRLGEGGAPAYDNAVRIFAEHDLWFLLGMVLRRRDVMAHPWVFDRCREVQADPNGFLDLWAREHFKSTIITFDHTFLDIIRDREVTIGIFSHTRPLAKGFLLPIKREMEDNQQLPNLWPNIFWREPRRQAPKWSEDEGLIVQRAGNPKEATLEAWGLVDGMPTGRHLKGRVYDDVVTIESVQSALMINKTTTMWELSDNLGMRGGWLRVAGTRYHLQDTYQDMLDRQVLKARVYAATKNGRLDGVPVLLTPDEWSKKKRAQRRTVWAQMLLKPLADGAATFDIKTLRGFQLRPAWLNVYITVDPSKGPQAKDKNSDNTAIAVIGVNAAGARYLLDGMCHRMRLSDRWLNLKSLVRKWRKEKGVLQVRVGYEQYGMQADIEYMEGEMRRDKEFFPIDEVNWPREGGHAKNDRIGRIEPWINDNQFFVPTLVHRSLCPTLGPLDKQSNPVKDAHGKELEWRWATWFIEEEPNVRIAYRGLRFDTRTMVQATEEGRAHLVVKPIIRRDDEGNLYDVTARFIQEFVSHPVGAHDDFLDVVSRLDDMDPVPAMVAALAADHGHQRAYRD